HQGIAFGFNTTDDCKLSDPWHCLPVIYAREKPSFNYGFKNEILIMAPHTGMPNIQRVSFKDDTFRAAISTKTPAWEYEKEWRYVEEEYGLFDFPGNLVQVVFGMRMSQERKLHYKKIIDSFIENDVEYLQIIESKSLDGLETKRLDSI
ncbi:TPA: DUF2971 domain-containing protein, partial [Aeromonas veronii]